MNDGKPNDSPGTPGEKGLSKRLPPEGLTREDSKKLASERAARAPGAAGGNQTDLSDKGTAVTGGREFPRPPPASAAVCGDGVGAEVIQLQVNDLRVLDLRKVVSDSRDQAFIVQRDALIDGFARLLPMEEEKRTTMARATLSGFKPLVETFNLSIRPFTTQNLHVVGLAEFKQMTGGFVTTEEQQTRFITCMDLLIQEAIINKIPLNDAIVKSMSQLIWNDSLSRCAFGVVGTYISIILARDSLLLFANSVLRTISVGHLTLDQLTLYCAYVYNNCTSENLIDLLVYLGAGNTDAAKEYLKTLLKFVDVQVKYIVMLIYILGLQTFSGQRPISPHIQILLDEMAARGARPAAGAHPVGYQIPSQDAARANIQRGLAPDAAAAAAAPPAVPPAGQAGNSIWNGSVEAFNLVREGITSFFMRGFNFTASSVTDIFKLYGARGSHGQGFFVHLNNALQALSNTGGRAIQARAGVVNPNLDEETNRLIAALMGITINRDTTNADLEQALGLFSREISENMLKILREGFRRDKVAVVKHKWSFLDEPRFSELQTVFVQRAQGGGGGVNMERFQSFCQHMPLFRSALTTERVADRSGRPLELSDSQLVAGPGEDSMAQMDAQILTADLLTTELLNGVRSRLQRFGESYMDAAGKVAVLAKASGEPATNPKEVIQRVADNKKLQEYQTNIIGSIEKYLEEELRAGQLSQEQRSLISEDLRQRVNALNMDHIRNYIISQDPRSGVPQTLTYSLGNFFNRPIPAGLQSVRDTVKNAIIRGAGNLTASLYNAVMNSGAATATLARDCMNRIRLSIFEPAHIVAEVPPGEAPAPGPQALLQNIDIALDQAVPAPVGEVEVDPAHAVDRQGDGENSGMDKSGGRSRSRKRSASKRTRRNGVAKKQKSKKNKRQSRRYVRRASSRKSRK
jgi:hypothetical protein